MTRYETNLAAIEPIDVDQLSRELEEACSKSTPEWMATEPRAVAQQVDAWKDVLRGIRYLEAHQGKSDLPGFAGPGSIWGITTDDWARTLIKCSDLKARVLDGLRATKQHDEDFEPDEGEVAAALTSFMSSGGITVPDDSDAYEESNHEQQIEATTKASVAVDPNSRPQFKPAKPNPTVEEPKQPATEPKQDAEGSERLVEEDGTGELVSPSKAFAKVPIKWLSLDLTKQELKVLLALASWAKGQPRYPEVKTIAARAGMGYSHSCKVLKSLRAKGIIGMEKKLHPKSKDSWVTFYEIKVW